MRCALRRETPARGLQSPMRRRRSGCTMFTIAAALLAGCAAPLPALQWIRLPAEAPGAALPVAAGGGSAVRAEDAVQLLLPVGLPGHLDRDALLLPPASAALSGVQVQGATRWAEPLRDAVPRLLHDDLSRLLGAGRVWVSPLPPGFVPARQLRIDFQAFDVVAGAPYGVTLAARWSLADARGATPPQVHGAQFSVPVASADAQAIAGAHRVALRLLAEQVAGSVRQR